MMYDTQKSDSGVVPTKAANQGARVPAEWLEGRAGIERNPGGGPHGPHAEAGGRVTRR